MNRQYRNALLSSACYFPKIIMVTEEERKAARELAAKIQKQNKKARKRAA